MMIFMFVYLISAIVSIWYEGEYSFSLGLRWFFRDMVGIGRYGQRTTPGSIIVPCLMPGLNTLNAIIGIIQYLKHTNKD
jgi:hypothetical protein